MIEHGESWDDAHERASELARENGTAYIHPFDDPEVWTGHATLIEEVARIAPAPAAVVVSVGGGGLLCGVLEGLERVGWADVSVLAVETEGAASFAASWLPTRTCPRKNGGNLPFFRRCSLIVDQFSLIVRRAISAPASTTAWRARWRGFLYVGFLSRKVSCRYQRHPQPQFPTYQTS